MDTLSQTLRERLNYLDFRVYFTGQIGRHDLIKRFGISEAAATRDLATYREQAPRNLEFDSAAKLYRITPQFRPHFIDQVDSKVILRALVHGIGDDFGVTPSPLVPCELPFRLHAPNIAVLAAICRAIHARSVAELEYLSESGLARRQIVPFALAGNGLRWHVRGYDRKRKRFGDFVINRIREAAVLTDESVQPHETKEADDDWNRKVVLEIVPHPRVKHKAMVEQEHGMTDGVLVHKTRAALCGYVLRLWNVDCSPTHELEGREYQLWLRNSVALYGINNITIAPGYRA